MFFFLFGNRYRSINELFIAEKCVFTIFSFSANNILCIMQKIIAELKLQIFVFTS